MSNNNLHEPKIAVVNSHIPNAFATGNGYRSSVVAVTKGLLEILDQEELEGVLAHELTRIKNRDVVVMTLDSLFSTKAWEMTQFGFFGGMYGTGRDRNNGLSMIIIILVSLVTWIVSFLIARTISRYREYSAGSGAGQMSRKPASLAKALLKISGTMHKVSPKELKHMESCNAFFIIPAISGDPLTQRFSTHPPIEKRIEIVRHGVGYASILTLVRERYETKDEFQFEIVFNIHLTLCSSNENWTRDDYHQKMFGVYCYPLFKI